MKKISQYTFIIIAVVSLTIYGCKDEDYELGDLVPPSDVSLTYEIVGADSENPYGDGSGKVSFTVTANNALTYNFDFGDGTDIETVPSGTITKQFAITGVNTYNVTAYAVGTGGITSSKADQVEVLSTFEDPDALEFLTGGSSKTWYWAYDQAGFAGLGPTAEDYGNLEYTWAAWWQISANDPDKACMYDAEFVFTKTGEFSLTYEQTVGQAWIPGTYAGKIGVDGDQCYGEDVAPALYGVKNVSFAPSTSLASIDGGYRGTTMNFSDGGFMCWWVGASSYDIIEITENTLTVRIKEDDTYAWYHTFTSVKPEE